MSKTFDKVQSPPKYDVVMEKDKSLATIKVLDGPFFGMEYSYGVVSVSNPTDDGELILNFTFDITKGVIKEESREEAEEVIASILYDIVTNYSKRMILYDIVTNYSKDYE